MLIVDFKVGDSDCVGDVGGYARFNTLEEVLASSWNETRLFVCTHHRVGLPRARLAIGEDTCMVAFEVMIQEILSQRIIDIFLMRIMRVCRVVRPEGIIEGKLLLLHNLATLRPSIGWIGGIRYEQFGSLSL